MRENTEISRTRKIQFLCLLTVLAMEILLLLTENRAGGLVQDFLKQYLTIPAMIFWGIAICSCWNRQTKPVLLLGGAVMVWFVVIWVIHRSWYVNPGGFGTTACVYALALPFAAATEDAQRQRGLYMTGIFFLGTGVMLLGYGAMLMLGVLPQYLRNHVFWHGARFSAIGYPNICAVHLMIGIAFCAGFFLRIRSRWGKGVMVLLVIAQFLLLCLTNGRAGTIITCALLGGLVFCVLRRPGWKRLAAAALLGILVTVSLFGISQKLFFVHAAHLTKLAVQEQETEAGEESSQDAYDDSQMLASGGQSTLKKSMGTLNGRTIIWRTILEELRWNRKILAVGTDNVEAILQDLWFEPQHAHNSWLQNLCTRGIIGLLLSLVLTVMAVRDAVVLLWRNTDLWKSCIALLTLCLLGCAMMEPYLFCENIVFHYFDFLFLLCLGYMELWRREKP